MERLLLSRKKRHAADSAKTAAAAAAAVVVRVDDLAAASKALAVTASPPHAAAAGKRLLGDRVPDLSPASASSSTSASFSSSSDNDNDYNDATYKNVAYGNEHTRWKEKASERRKHRQRHRHRHQPPQPPCRHDHAHRRPVPAHHAHHAHHAIHAQHAIHAIHAAQHATHPTAYAYAHAHVATAPAPLLHGTGRDRNSHVVLQCCDDTDGISDLSSPSEPGFIKLERRRRAAAARQRRRHTLWQQQQQQQQHQQHQQHQLPHRNQQQLPHQSFQPHEQRRQECTQQLNPPLPTTVTTRATPLSSSIASLATSATSGTTSTNSLIAKSRDCYRSVGYISLILPKGGIGSGIGNGITNGVGKNGRSSVSSSSSSSSAEMQTHDSTSSKHRLMETIRCSQMDILPTSSPSTSPSSKSLGNMSLAHLESSTISPARTNSAAMKRVASLGTIMSLDFGDGIDNHDDDDDDDDHDDHDDNDDNDDDDDENHIIVVHDNDNDNNNNNNNNNNNRNDRYAFHECLNDNDRGNCRHNDGDDFADFAPVDTDTGAPYGGDVESIVRRYALSHHRRGREDVRTSCGCGSKRGPCKTRTTKTSSVQSLPIITSFMSSPSPFATAVENVHSATRLLRAEGSYKEATELYSSVLGKHVGLYQPSELPYVSSVLHHLAVLYTCDGSYNDAQVLCNEALQIRRDELNHSRSVLVAASAAANDDADADADADANSFGGPSGKRASGKEDRENHALSDATVEVETASIALERAAEDVSNTLCELAVIKYARGDFQGALGSWWEALRTVVDNKGGEGGGCNDGSARARRRGRRTPESFLSSSSPSSSSSSLSSSSPSDQKERRHPRAIRILNNMGCAHYESGRYKSALTMFQEAASLRRSTLGSARGVGAAGALLDVSTALCNAAATLIAMSRLGCGGCTSDAGCGNGQTNNEDVRQRLRDRALSLLEEGLMLQRSVLGDDHRKVKGTEAALAEAEATDAAILPMPMVLRVVKSWKEDDAEVECEVDNGKATDYDYFEYRNDDSDTVMSGVVIPH